MNFCNTLLNLILVLTSRFWIYRLSYSVFSSACNSVGAFVSAGVIMELSLAGLTLFFLLYIGLHFCGPETHNQMVIVIVV